MVVWKASIFGLMDPIIENKYRLLTNRNKAQQLRVWQHLQDHRVHMQLPWSYSWHPGSCPDDHDIPYKCTWRFRWTVNNSIWRWSAMNCQWVKKRLINWCLNIIDHDLGCIFPTEFLIPAASNHSILCKSNLKWAQKIHDGVNGY